jgi:hypothetical protein
MEKALAHVCVLMLSRASNIGHFANGVAARSLEQVATTKIPDLYAKTAIIRQLISLPAQALFRGT